MGPGNDHEIGIMTMPKRARNFKRLILGDVLEIPLSKHRFAYAQFIYYYKDPPVWGSLIRVLPGVFSRRPDSFSKLVQEQERFVAFFPAGVAVKSDYIQIVANEEIPALCRELPLFKCYNQNLETGRRTWWLWDGRKESFVGRLSREQIDLPLCELISMDTLIERIKTGWAPRDEAEDGPPSIRKDVRRS